jgi:hypothetical protein
MTFGTLAVEILPLKKGNIVLTSHPPLSLTLTRAGEEEGPRGRGGVKFQNCVIY